MTAFLLLGWPLVAALAFLLIFTKGTKHVVLAYAGTANRITYRNPAIEQIWRRRRDKVRDNLAALWNNIPPADKSHVLQIYH